MRHKKDRVGCMGALISIFDFQSDRLTQKLLSGSRRDGRHADDAGYSRNKTGLLVNSDERCQGCNDNEEITTVTAGADKPPSVKKLIQQELYSEQDPKKLISNPELEAEVSTSECGGRVRKNKKKNKKAFKKSHNVHTHDFNADETMGSKISCQRDLEEELTCYLNLNAIIDELCRQIFENKLTGVNDNQHVVQSRQQFSVSEEKLSEATEVFITQKFIIGKHVVADNEENPHDKEFVDALKTLNLNRELLIRLLQDPNSLLVTRVQILLDSQLVKDGKYKSLAELNTSGQELSNSRPLEFVGRKQHNFFRKKNNSHGKNPPSRLVSAQELNRIVILKPGPAGLQNSESERGLASSHYITSNKRPIERAASHFSFAEMKRKFTRAVSKDRHGISSDDHNLRDGDKGILGELFERNSPTRDHFFNENFPKASIGIKNGIKIGMPKDCLEPLALGNLERKVPSIYIEAKKHISEMLGGGDGKEEFLRRPDLESLGRILSLAEYYFSPVVCPGRDSDHSLVSAQMRLSAHRQFKQAKDSCLDPSVQSLGNQSGISDDKPYEKIKAPSTDEVVHDIEVEKALCSAEKETHSNVYLEIVETTSSLQEGSNVLDAYSEPSSSSIIGNIQNEQVDASSLNRNISDEVICDNEGNLCSVGNEMRPDAFVVDVEMEEMTHSVVQGEKNVLDTSSEQSIRNKQKDDSAEICDEEIPCKSLKVELTEENQPPSSPSASPSSPLTIKETEHLESLIDRPERPSPVSVLDPLFADDDIGPVGSTEELPIQRLEIQFEEQDSSAKVQINHLKTRTVDKETISEYVKAVLQASSLSWDDMFMMSLSSDQLLCSSLFQVELSPNQHFHDQKLLFDCINEGLVEVFERYFACSPSVSFVKPIIRPVPDAKSVINEVWEGIDWHPHPVHSTCTMDQILRKDMAKSGMWMDLRSDAESVGIEMGEAIIEELLEDTIWSCMNGREAESFPAVLVELLED